MSGKICYVIISNRIRVFIWKNKIKNISSNLNPRRLSEIAELFIKLYVLLPVKRISSFVQKVKRLSLDNEIICCNSANSYVLAVYLNNQSSPFTFDTRPAIVKNIYLVNVILVEGSIERHASHWLCEVDWLKVHQQKNFYGINSPTKIWDTQVEPFSLKSFVHAKLIVGHYVCYKKQVRFTDERSVSYHDKVNIITPLPSEPEAY